MKGHLYLPGDGDETDDSIRDRGRTGNLSSSCPPPQSAPRVRHHQRISRSRSSSNREITSMGTCEPDLDDGDNNNNKKNKPREGETAKSTGSSTSAASREGSGSFHGKQRRIHNRSSHSSSRPGAVSISTTTTTTTLLQQEKQGIAYPKYIMNNGSGHQQHGKSLVETSARDCHHQQRRSSAPVVVTMFGGGPNLRGIGKNQDLRTGSTRHHRRSRNHRRRRRSTMRGIGKNDHPVAEAADSSTSSTNDDFFEDDLPSSSHELSLLSPMDRDIVVSPLDDDDDDDDDIDIVVPPITVDGVESHNPNETGEHQGQQQPTNNSNGRWADEDFRDHSEDCNRGEEAQQQQQQQQQQRYNARSSSPDPSSSSSASSVSSIDLPDLMIDNSDLVEARPVASSNRSSFFYLSRRMSLAEPVDQIQRLGNLVQRQAARESKEKTYQRIALGIVVLACLVLIVSLAVGLTNQNKNKEQDDVVTIDDRRPPLPPLAPTTTTTTLGGDGGNPAMPLPPMKNLELLYRELPQKTKTSLSNRNSPQYKAWEWLLNHPNLPTFPEWRKQQIFAMVTFYFAFEGPNWPQETPASSRWLDIHASECDWVFTDQEVKFFTAEGIQVFGPNAYDNQIFHPCNTEGKLQTLGVHQLFLPADLKPSIPPQIGLLTSLKLLGIAFSQIDGAKLSDWLTVPELIQLPNLQGLNLRGNGAGGTIPKEIEKMTTLRHLLIGANTLTGTIPTEIAGMIALEYFNVGDEKGITGTLPSEFGLMTKLTGLSVYRTSVGGTIPSELGSLSHLETFYLGGNNVLVGVVPSELGLLTNLVQLQLGNDFELQNDNNQNDFSGSLPEQLWEQLSNLEYFHLPNLPNLYVQIPLELNMPNLVDLNLKGSPHISGTIPDQACLFIDELEFDCSDTLCGCECQCTS